jgi:hypothetical protein
LAPSLTATHPPIARPKCFGKGDVPHTKVNLSIFCYHFLYGRVQGRGGKGGGKSKKEGKKKKKCEKEKSNSHFEIHFTEFVFP